MSLGIAVLIAASIAACTLALRHWATRRSRIDSRDVPAVLAEVERLVGRNQIDPACQLLRRALEDCPGHPAYRLRLAEL